MADLQDLITDELLAELKAFLGVETNEYDTLLLATIFAIFGYLQSYTGRYLTETDLVEYYDGDDLKDNIYLKNYPIVIEENVHELKIEKLLGDTWTEIDASEYTLYQDDGILYFKNGVPNGKNNIRVIYTAGFAEAPYDLILVMYKIAGKVWNRRGAEGLSSVSTGSESASFAEFIGKDEKNILDTYKRMKI